MSRGRFLQKRASVCSLSSLRGPATVKVIVGEGRREFLIPRDLLTSCHYFRDQIDSARLDFSNGKAYLLIFLEGQCPDMFALFSYWLYGRKGFDKHIDAIEDDESAAKELHWDFVNLHMFAAQLGIPELQDFAMDGIQDLYLRCNWDIDPKLVNYAFTECAPEESYRLRKWIVTMVAWTFSDVQTSEAADEIRSLFGDCPGLLGEYTVHLNKILRSRLDVRFKNPQLRLPSNQLRAEERQFGFRQCTFHTHRSTVGQGKCLHTLNLSPTVPSPSTDGYVESDSDRCESRFGSCMVSPSGDVIFESDLETR